MYHFSPETLLFVTSTHFTGHRRRGIRRTDPVIIHFSLYFSLCEKALSLEKTKKNGFSFGSLLAYAYLCSQINHLIQLSEVDK